MRRQAICLLPILIFSGCRGDSPTGASATESLQFPEVTGTYKAVLTTFARWLDGPRRGQPISTVCPGELILSEQQGSVFFAELTMFHQGECFPVEAEYRGGVTTAGGMILDITFIHPPQFEGCVQTSAASTATYRGTYGGGRLDIDRRVVYSCAESGGRTSEMVLTERIEGLPPDA